MGVSSDYSQQLERFVALESFFDAVKNPDKYLDLIKQSKDTLAKIKDLVGPYDTVKAANALKAEVEKYKADAVADVDAEYKALEDERSQVVRDLKLQREKLDADKLELAEERYKLTVAKDQLKADQSLVQGLTAKMIAGSDANARYKQELDKLKAELDDKAKKLQAILG